MQNPAETPEQSTGWPRRHVLKAGALAVGAGLLGRFANAAEGTIRKVHALSIGENSVHGSDAPETAREEIAYWFSGTEVVG